MDTYSKTQKLNDQQSNPQHYHPYGPEIKTKRYQFAENTIRTSSRSKVKIFTRKDNPITEADNLAKTQAIINSKFYNPRGESSQISNRLVLS